ncbi:hypothetical protein HK097_007267 [Rhizophlyctis rosea]|uniref:Uncharacterized protein n=1 Tax=Rhizophlyctis rosea TaxID=64517 RepID=A0AAD5SJR0_9FUNG|nr:hypothetical protein HK097_007267 [Rhizophlyctis rosea]
MDVVPLGGWVGPSSTTGTTGNGKGAGCGSGSGSRKVPTSGRKRPHWEVDEEGVILILDSDEEDGEEEKTGRERKKRKVDERGNGNGDGERKKKEEEKKRKREKKEGGRNGKKRVGDGPLSCGLPDVKDHKKRTKERAWDQEVPPPKNLEMKFIEGANEIEVPRWGWAVGPWVVDYLRRGLQGGLGLR